MTPTIEEVKRVAIECGINAEARYEQGNLHIMDNNLEFEAYYSNRAPFEINGVGLYCDQSTQALWSGWKACAAIKDAEIAARDLMIKDLLADFKRIVTEGDYTAPEGMKRIAKEALAKTEHHNSRALEKMLLEARIEALEEVNGLESWVIDREISDYKAELAELNKE